MFNVKEIYNTKKNQNKNKNITFKYWKLMTRPWTVFLSTYSGRKDGTHRRRIYKEGLSK